MINTSGKYRRASMDLFYWQKSPSGSFKDMLFDLIAKADHGNRILLSNAFPEHVQVYEAWCKSPDPEVFLQNCLPKNTLTDRCGR